MIQWQIDKHPYANGKNGFIGVIRVFYLGYNVMKKQDREEPYQLTTTLPQMRTYRFKTIEKGKKYAEKMLKEFTNYLKKNMRKK